jgi:hypothetical protein
LSSSSVLPFFSPASISLGKSNLLLALVTLFLSCFLLSVASIWPSYLGTKVVSSRGTFMACIGYQALVRLDRGYDDERLVREGAKEGKRHYHTRKRSIRVRKKSTGKRA